MSDFTFACFVPEANADIAAYYVAANTKHFRLASSNSAGALIYCLSADHREILIDCFQASVID